MRLTTEIPDHVWSLNLPDIPDAVFADVLVFEEGHVEIVVAAGFDVLQGLFAFGFAEGFEEVGDDFFDEVFLVGAHFGETKAFEPRGLAGELHGFVSVFLARALDERPRALLAVKRLEDLVRALCLKPVGVAFM